MTKIQLCALQSVARSGLFHGASHAHGNTMRSLEHAGLIEHTATGWRLTPEGRAALKERP